MAGTRRLQSRRRVLVVALAAAVVIGGAGAAWAATHRSSAAAADAPQLVAATTSTVKQTVSATGTIQPAQQANLQFGQSGTVTAVSVQVGQQIAAGTPVATIDDTSLRSAVTVAEAQLNAARAQLTAAQTAGNAAQIASANAQVASTQSKLTSAQQSLGQATLTTPLGGTVAAVNLKVGDQVTGSSTGSGSSSGSGAATSGTGTGGSGAGGSGAGGSAGSSSGAASSASASSVQIVVISTSSWLVNAGVGAADLPQLASGMQATITPSGATDPVFGTVSTVGVIGTTSGGTATFPVTIAVTGSPAGLYAGSTATVLITVKQIPEVLTVPTQAVHDVAGQSVVYQMKDGVQVNTPVTVGAVYGATTQITKGLSDGDQVVVPARTSTPRGTSTRGTGGGGTGGTGGAGGGFGGSGLGGGTLPGSGTAPRG